MRLAVQRPQRHTHGGGLIGRARLQLLADPGAELHKTLQRRTVIPLQVHLQCPVHKAGHRKLRKPYGVVVAISLIATNAELFEGEGVQSRTVLASAACPCCH